MCMVKQVRCNKSQSNDVYDFACLFISTQFSFFLLPHAFLLLEVSVNYENIDANGLYLGLVGARG